MKRVHIKENEDLTFTVSREMWDHICACLRGTNKSFREKRDHIRNTVYDDLMKCNSYADIIDLMNSVTKAMEVPDQLSEWLPEMNEQEFEHALTEFLTEESFKAMVTNITIYYSDGGISPTLVMNNEREVQKRVLEFIDQYPERFRQPRAEYETSKAIRNFCKLVSNKRDLSDIVLAMRDIQLSKPSQ